MVNEGDYKKQEELLNLSLDIARLVTKTRQEEGVVFDND